MKNVWLACKRWLRRWRGHLLPEALIENLFGKRKSTVKSSPIPMAALAVQRVFHEG
uniref:Uncharacterized protein n=1 Tax=Magnetococcus massalia (strain MO-1) TaxID=451514 RepID=A0A1S7LM21_MAGMO|nr:protein of unknown function [Candidatus Magnetococcus massalia]